MAGMLSLVLAATCLVGPLSAINVPSTDFESRIVQNYPQAVNTAVNEMVKKYHNVEYIFKAYETYLMQGDIYFPCFSNFVSRTVNEFFRQKELLIEFMVSRGGANRYISPQLEETCKLIITDTSADLGDVTDSTSRMCICKEVSGAPAFGNWPGQACPPSIDPPRTGKVVLEDLVAAMRYLRHHNEQLLNTAKTLNDPNLERLLRNDHLRHLTDQIFTAVSVRTQLNDVLVNEPENYEMYEEYVESKHMCRMHLTKSISSPA